MPPPYAPRSLPGSPGAQARRRSAAPVRSPSSAPLLCGGGTACRVQPGLRPDEPLLAARRQGFASLPQRERLLEGRRTLLQLGYDTNQLIASLLIAEGFNIFDRVRLH